MPWVGEFEIGEIEQIVDTSAFQKLFDRKQLGFNDLVFRSAHSSRGEILLITWLKTKILTERLVEAGDITPEVANNINLASLLHDVGHGPFSHVIEFLVSVNHEENGARLIEEDNQLQRAIVGCGGDPDFVVECLRHQRPEFVIVDDKNFGVDKLVYLVMARYDTGFGPDIGPVVDNVIKYLKYDSGKMMIDAKAINAAMLIQYTYHYFYKDVFISKSSQNIQRYMQKLFYFLLQSEPEISERKLWQMTDMELMSHVANSKHPVVKYGYEDVFRRGPRAFPCAGLTVKLHGRGYAERHSQKPNSVIETDKDFFEKFCDFCDIERLNALENEISDFLGIDSRELVIASLSAEKLKRFEPQNFFFYNSRGSSYTGSFKEVKPKHFEGLADDINDCTSVRVCATPEFRPIVYKKAGDVFELIKNKIGA